MGTWGPAIFSDDLASDIRDEWRALIGDGVSPEDATARITAGYAASLADPGDRNVVVLALALSQWKTGRLLDSVRDAALEVIGSGSDLARWDEGPLRRAREKALAQAREQLMSPQPAAKKIAKRQLSQTPFVPGDMVSYEHDSGNRFLLWVYYNLTDKDGDYSAVEVLDFVGQQVPGLAAAVLLPAMERRHPPRGDGSLRRPERLGFILTRAASIPPHRVEVIGTAQRPEDRPRAGQTIAAATELDGWLRPFLPGGDHVLRRPDRR